MEHLIECVRRYPCLWNTTAIEYRDQELKDAAWTEVMKETELSSVKEVKLKWKKLRDSYRDALKRQSETAAGGGGGGGGGGKRSSAWKYTGQMHFLQPYMNNRKKPAELVPAPALPSAPVAPPENGHHGSEPEAEPEPEPDSEDEDSESSSPPPPPAAVPAPLQLTSLAAPVSSRKRASSPDPIETFFTGMCQATRRLPFPAQLRIKRALFEAVAAGEEALLADHRRYAAAAAALWPRAGAGSGPASRGSGATAAAAPAGDSSSSDDDAGDA